MPLNHIGQFRRQLIQIGDIQKGIPVNPFNILLVTANSCRNKQNTFSLILLFNTSKILLCS